MRQLAGFLLLMSAFAVTAKAADEVTIYRCTDGSGRLTLRDTPCGKDQKQQTRNMLRPKDAPVVRTPPPPRLRDDYTAPPLPPDRVVSTCLRPADVRHGRLRRRHLGAR